MNTSFLKRLYKFSRSLSSGILHYTSGGELTVFKWSLVDFLISMKYKDKVWCDIVPVNACHLFFVRLS